jgi:hypothetical protein
MHYELAREEVLQILDGLIRESEDRLKNAQGQLQKVRTSLLTLTVREHIEGVGSLSPDENERRETAVSEFKGLCNRIAQQNERLAKLRSSREEWETGLPTSLQESLAALLEPAEASPTASSG